MKKNLLRLVFLAAIASTALSAKCRFDTNLEVNFYGLPYTCHLEEATYTYENEDFIIEGLHQDERNDDDVDYFLAVNQTLDLIPQQIFDRFQNLGFVRFAGVGLKELHQRWENCSNLTHIFIEDNKLTTLPRRIFDSCAKVRYMKLHRNGIETVEEDAFRYLRNLYELSLADNRIARIPLYIFPDTMSNLAILNLNNAGLQVITMELISFVDNIESVDLSNNNISKIERNTFAYLSHLREINLSFNPYLSEIESFAFRLLPELLDIWLDNGSIYRLNSEIFDRVPKLTSFHLNNNKISEIERDLVDNFPYLKNLGLSGNLCVDDQFTGIESINETNYREALETCFRNFEVPPTTESPTTISIPTEVSISTEVSTSTGSSSTENPSTTTQGASQICLNIILMLIPLLLRSLISNKFL